MRFRLRSSEQTTHMTHRVHGRPLAPPWPDGMQAVLFGVGCFWSGERRFWDIDGVWTTAAGFTPDHTEVVLVVFDPHQVSLDRLLGEFWASTDPSRGTGLYGSVIGTDDPGIQAAVGRSIEERRTFSAQPVRTRVVSGDMLYAGMDQQQYLH